METVTTKQIDLQNPITFVFAKPENRGNRRGQSRYEIYSERRWANLETKRNIEVLHRDRHRFPLAGARWKMTAYVQGATDFDNLVALMKWPLDWLVDRGVVADDSRKYLWPLTLPEMIVARKEEARLVVTLYPVKETLHEKRVYGDKAATKYPKTIVLSPALAIDDCGPGDGEE